MIFSGSDSELMMYLTLNQEFKVYILLYFRIPKITKASGSCSKICITWDAMGGQ